MAPGSIILALMLVGLWFIVLNSWQLRNWRAVAVACLGTGAILLAGLVPWPWRPWVQAGVWAALLLVFLTRTELVTVMSPAEYRFVGAYIEILRRLGRLTELGFGTEPVALVAEYEGAVRSLERLEAPVEWAQLKADTVRELRRRLAIMKLVSARPADGTLEVAEAQWLEVMKRFRRTLKAKAGFWRGWPHLTTTE